MKADHYVGGNKLIGLDPEDPKYDPLEKWACVAQELAAKLKASNERVKELRVERAAVNERIKQLEEQILRAQKQKEITHKVIEQIAQEGATSKTIEALLNAHFWGLV
jgi:predicted nuclease with TOPRIM domain